MVIYGAIEDLKTFICKEYEDLKIFTAPTISLTWRGINESIHTNAWPREEEKDWRMSTTQRSYQITIAKTEGLFQSLSKLE